MLLKGYFPTIWRVSFFCCYGKKLIGLMKTYYIEGDLFEMLISNENGKRALKRIREFS